LSCFGTVCDEGVAQIIDAETKFAVKTKEKKTETKVGDRDRLIEAWRVMHFALRAVIAEPDRMLAARGLTRVHHRILFFLARTPGLSVGELQATLDVTKQALNTPLKQLREQGLLDFAKADHDARVKKLELTADGAALESKLTGEQLQMFSAAFTEHSHEAVNGWFAVTQSLANRLQRPTPK
jgi:DNA-binding MarR family transcriptional regulator